MIFMKDRYLHSTLHRGITELLARFGYASINEIMYGFHLNPTQAVDRLRYLQKQGFIRRFSSHTLPSSFYCLTSLGRQAVQGFDVYKSPVPFRPSSYQPAYQRHHRNIMMVFLALRNMLGSSFMEWTGECAPKSERTRRVLDGELHLKVRKTPYRAGVRGGYVPALDRDPVFEEWCCGVKIELFLKSPALRRKHFDRLASDYRWDNGKVFRHPMYLFIYSTRLIHDRLVEEFRRHDFGECVFFFGQFDELIAKQGEAILERWVGKSCTTTPASDMAKVSFTVK
jgi:hypothetical protein